MFLIDWNLTSGSISYQIFYSWPLIPNLSGSAAHSQIFSAGLMLE
jgi:hypothetical protein